MEPKSELEHFLASHSSVGPVDSHGVFTIDLKEALRKVAEYQLPFAGAWAVKIIQSIVAGGSSGPVRVDLKTKEVRFTYLQAGFTLDELVTAYHDPTPSLNRSLRHLLSGLWSVGLKEGWGFQVALPGQKETVIWDGERMFRVDSRAARQQVCISIAPTGSYDADILLLLSERCYACPLPLTVDGHRIDSLQRAQYHGWSKTSYPLAVDFAEAPIPELRLPPGTFLGVTQPLKSHFLTIEPQGDAWARIAERQMRGLRTRETAAVTVLLSLNTRQITSVKKRSWIDTEGPSTVYWISDGALVSEEPLVSGNSHCGVGCFVNAEGLETDLSTFHLLESPERAQRLASVRQALLTTLEAVGDKTCEEIVKRASRLRSVSGAAILALSVTSLLWTAIPAMVGAIVGGVLVRGAGKNERIKVQPIRASLDELRTRLTWILPG